ncbi:MAG: pentapeptide repeat-containing protein [Coleofasciculus sp. B1-GNL1-01]|uniref:nSTAND1 domain-containing NTPase n=1 Tax=Coleofasciculus sp. B1-GNL1-01 TaxID=3068484 RepID=UPI0032F1BBCC
MSRDALVIGINKYERFNPLNAPGEDAEAVAQRLEQYGEFKVTRLPGVKDKQNNRIRVGQKTTVTLSQLEDAIIQLFMPEGRSVPDTAILYFSGHGLRKSRGIQEGFLASSDVNPEAGNWGLSLQWLRRLLLASEVRQQIIILDCCYSGEVLNVAEADPGERGKGRDRCFIAASREFEVAYEGIDGSHSAFTAALLEALEPQSERWVTNHTLVERLNQVNSEFPQRPIFANSGEPINLTRRLSVAVSESIEIPQPAICPYKGLAYFDCNQEDPKYFYGRTALTDKLLDQVRQGNFLAILGASGSGKSSVLRAGLLHQLKLGRRLSGSEAWEVRILTPGEHPLQSLALAFLSTEASGIERAAQLKQGEELLAEGATGLRRLVQASTAPRVVLVIDQFEEAFTLCQDEEERELFFACLLGVTSTSSVQESGLNLCIILAMRADFFGKCVERNYSGLGQQIQHNMVTVTPMKPEELTQAIVEPAKRVELAVEPELVEQMITDVEGSPGSLPLLQYTLMELWNRRNNHGLSLATYSQLGGVMGTLQKRATEVYEEFSTPEKEVAKHIFLSLTQLGEGTEDTRRRVLKQDLVTSRHSEALINRVVQRLADVRLIVTQEVSTLNQTSKTINPNSVVVDVEHEALIRHWIVLRRWLNESRDHLREKRKIEAAAEEWRSWGKAKDYLLQGKRLREAREFQKEKVEGFPLSNFAKEFIGTSVRRKQINRVKIIVGVLIIPLIGTGFVGIGIYRERTIKIYREVLMETKGSESRQARQERIEAVKKLSWLRDTFNGGLLQGADLREADLRGANLSRAYLQNADLQEAHLGGANLQEAYLGGANLQEANLQEADLSGAVLSGAVLREADLSGAVLREADLSGADLSGANLWDADLQEAYLRGAYLIATNLTLADLSGADLQVAYLRGAYLIATNLSGADLWEADLSGADLRRAYLRGAYLRGAYLRGAYLTPAQVKVTCDWQEANYSDNFRAELNSSPDPEEKVDCSRWSSGVDD